MIPDVDAALTTLLRRDALQALDVEVVLDVPTRDWAAKRSAPAVDLFLYDVREDSGHRHVGHALERDADGRVVSRRPPARRFRLGYLVTAWARRPEDEHRILATTLGVLLAYPVLPADLLGDGDGHAVGELRVGQPLDGDRAVSDLWSTLGGELRPSLTLAVTVPIAAGTPAPAGPPVTEPLQLHADQVT